MAGRKPGGPKTGGRVKGTPNKITATVKAAIERAFEEAGGHKYLLEQAKANPVAFMTLLGKLLPTQVTGANGGPIQLIGSEMTAAEAAAAYAATVNHQEG